MRADLGTWGTRSATPSPAQGLCLSRGVSQSGSLQGSNCTSLKRGTEVGPGAGCPPELEPSGGHLEEVSGPDFRPPWPPHFRCPRIPFRRRSGPASFAVPLPGVAQRSACSARLPLTVRESPSPPSYRTGPSLTLCSPPCADPPWIWADLTGLRRLPFASYDTDQGRAH